MLSGTSATGGSAGVQPTPLTDGVTRLAAGWLSNRLTWRERRSRSRLKLPVPSSPVETTVDSEGRILVPKHLRDSLGMQPGTTVDVTAYGAGLQVLPAGRTARIVQIDGKTVAESDTLVTDDVVFGLIDSLRR